MTDIAYVRTRDAAGRRSRRAPRSARSRWARENLFSSWLNTILTLIALFAVFCAGHAASGPGSRIRSGTRARCSECRQIIAETWGEGASGACLAVIRERWKQFLFGFYPITSTGGRRSPSC